jgi:NAD(P)-dependent dehydrogenase (short-subunit alcohol dehydrogenase family)
MLKGLAGKSVLVTGGSGGIGTEVCRRLSAEGSRVVVADLDETAAKEVAASLAGDAIGVGVDVTSPSGAQAAVDAAVQAFGRLDLVDINAGVECRAHPIVDFDIAEYHRVFNVNVLGAFLTAQAAVRAMTADGGGGGILVTSSLAAEMGTAGTSIYNSSKHAVHGMARCLALEVADAGIRVNTLMPGVVDTRMMRSLEDTIGAISGLSGEEFKAAMTEGVPLKRYAAPDEIAAMVAWILSDEVPYCHGEAFTVGGGIAPY